MSQPQPAPADPAATVPIDQLNLADAPPAAPATPEADTPAAASTDKSSKRTSGIKGLFNKLRPNKSKDGRQPESFASQMTGPDDASHPGGIIPATKRTAGDVPVQPVSPQVKHKPGGVISEVDVLVTKEAEKIMAAMAAMVENSGPTEGTGEIPLSTRDNLYPHESQGHEMTLPKAKWMEHWGETVLDKLFISHKMGVYVIVDRKTGAKIFETMPIFTRLGMHLLFVSVSHEILDVKAVEKLFADVSFRQGRIYDNPDPAFVVPHIEAFVKTYSIEMGDLLEPNVKKYKTFNDFFSRQLKPSARPVTDANDFTVITSPADSRLTVFRTVGDAKKFWIKGHEFTLASLLDDKHLAEEFGANPSIAVFRLAPQDYHRFHSPFQAKLGKQFHIAGTYFTVNPQAINENLNVFTANRRDVQLLSATISPPDTSTDPPTPSTPVTFAFVPVGALLVGSIRWSKSAGDTVMKGEDMGFFQYGGSTTILIAPENAVEWDEDLIKNSEAATETLVRVGERIGRALVGGAPIPMVEAI